MFTNYIYVYKNNNTHNKNNLRLAWAAKSEVICGSIRPKADLIPLPFHGCPRRSDAALNDEIALQQ